MQAVSSRLAELDLAMFNPRAGVLDRAAARLGVSATEFDALIATVRGAAPLSTLPGTHGEDVPAEEVD